MFGIAELDLLLPNSGLPILEIISPPPAHHPFGAGKTALLYLIIAHVILPASFSSAVPLGGQEAAVVLVDPLNHFDVSRLTSIMLSCLATAISSAGQDLDESTKLEMRTTVRRSLPHIHIFRPQSWPSLLATLGSLPDYLFNSLRHKSMHRRIHSLIFEDIDAFVWSIRNTPSIPLNPSNLLSTASTQLTSRISRLTSLLSSATILTSHSTLPSMFRPAVPISWPVGSTVTRLAVRRAEVLKFAPTISIEEAEAEREQRWEVLRRGRFECWKVGTGVGEEEGFIFSITVASVCVEKDER